MHRLLRAFFLILLLPALSLTANAKAAQTIEHIGIAWPTTNGMPLEPVFVYECTDTSCTSMTQIDYVTLIPEQGAIIPPVPAPVTFYNTNGVQTTYALYQGQTGAWRTCKFTIDANGKLVAGSDCTGAVETNNSSATVTMLSFSATGFTSSTDIDPPTADEQVTVPDRTLTFINKTNFKALCVNTKAEYNDPAVNKCADAANGDNVLLQGDANKLVVPVPPLGLIAGAAAVTGYQLDDGTWVNTGKYVNTQDPTNDPVYGTKMEWSIFPSAPVQTLNPTPADSTTNHTIGLTNIDVSAVDGYNIGVEMSADHGIICSSAEYDSQGNVLPAKYRLYTGTISKIPLPGSTLTGLCPAPSENFPYRVDDPNSGLFLGCLSECSHQKLVHGINSNQAQQACCSGAFQDVSVCVPSTNSKGQTHDQLPYVMNLHAGAERIYSWAYDDVQGDFSCEADASYVFTFESGLAPGQLIPPLLTSANIQPNEPGVIYVYFSHPASGGSGDFSYSATVPNFDVAKVQFDSVNQRYAVQLTGHIVPGQSVVSITVKDNKTNKTVTSNQILIQ